MKSLDPEPKKADQEGPTNLSTLHLKIFKGFVSSLKNVRAFPPQNPFERHSDIC